MTEQDKIRAAALKAFEEINAHWTRDELAENHCGMEVALDALAAALGLAIPAPAFGPGQ
jgi:hypothetical protein